MSGTTKRALTFSLLLSQHILLIAVVADANNSETSIITVLGKVELDGKTISYHFIYYRRPYVILTLCCKVWDFVEGIKV